MTGQGVERTLREMMQDRSYGRLRVQQSPGDGRPPHDKTWLQRVLDRLGRRSRN